MNKEIKEATMKTYRTKIKSMVGVDPVSVMLLFEPLKSEKINVSITLENDHINDKANKKDSLFLKRLMIPKLKKEIKKKHGVKEIELITVTCLMEFETSKISLFAEYYYMKDSNPKLVSNEYMIVI